MSRPLTGGKVKKSHNLLCDGKSKNAFVIFLRNFCMLIRSLCLEIYIHKASGVMLINICNVSLKHADLETFRIPVPPF
jgi:hypothetical protein